VLLALLLVAATVNVTVAAPTSELVTGPTISQVRSYPGATARYTISFQTLSQLSNDVDTIIIILYNEIGVPSLMDRNHISINTDLVAGGCFGGDPSGSIGSYPPSARHGYIRHWGGNSIAISGNVTVVLLLSAGLTNAMESGDDQVKVPTSVDTACFTVIATTPVIIELSTHCGSVVESLTLLANGVEGNSRPSRGMLTASGMLLKSTCAQWSRLATTSLPA